MVWRKRTKVEERKGGGLRRYINKAGSSTMMQRYFFSFPSYYHGISTSFQHYMTVDVMVLLLITKATDLPFNSLPDPVLQMLDYKYNADQIKRFLHE